jgi:hypothetical protein
MRFASLTQQAISPLIKRFADAEDVTLIIGAGASMEESLPSSPDLLERLLAHVAGEHPALTDAANRSDWIRRTLERDELLGAGAVIEVMGRDDLATLLPQALYGDAGLGSRDRSPSR